MKSSWREKAFHQSARRKVVLGDMRRSGNLALVGDLLFLSTVVALSCVLYVGRLGFYSDDWMFLAALHQAPDQSLFGLFRSIYTPWVHMRPVQILYLAGLYKLFGVVPLGYHICNALVFDFSVLLFYLTLRATTLSRLLALVAPLLYALAPHYSTDRFWVAAFQANLSVALYFLSLLAALHALKTSRSDLRSLWMAISLMSAAASILAYEVVLPLFFFNVLIFVIRYRRERSVGARPRALYAFAGGYVLTLVAISMFKFLTTSRLGQASSAVALGSPETTASHPTTLFRFIRRISLLGRIMRDALGTVFDDYGVRLPHTIWKTICVYPHAPTIALALVVALLTFSYLYLIAGDISIALPQRAIMMKLLVIGVAVFIMGYFVFFATGYYPGFTPTGVNNRTAIAAAIGVALTTTAVVGLLSTLFSSLKLRKFFFGATVAILCACGFLIVNTIAAFWSEAARRQDGIIAEVGHQVPTLPDNTTILIGGIQPYVGPAPVFECYWDVGGMLQIVYENPTLRGDVATPQMMIGEQGVSATIYGEKHFYPYGERLLLYQVGAKKLSRLTDGADAAQAMREAISAQPDNALTPAGREGYGDPIF